MKYLFSEVDVLLDFCSFLGFTVYLQCFQFRRSNTGRAGMKLLSSVLHQYYELDIFALYTFSCDSRFLKYPRKYVPLGNYFSDHLKSQLYLKRKF